MMTSLRLPVRPACAGMFTGAVLGVLLCASVSAAQCIDYRDHLRWLSRVSMSTGTAGAIELSGSWGYVQAGVHDLAVVDFSDPVRPLEHHTVALPEQAYDLTIDGGFLYAAVAWHGVWIFDVSTPGDPQPAGTLANSPDGAADVAVRDGIAYIACGSSGFQVADVSAPAQPSVIGSTSLPAVAVSVALAGNYAYVASNGWDGTTGANVRGVSVIDISDPQSPAPVSRLATPADANDLCVQGGFLYIADTSALLVVDISDPANPLVVGSLATGNGTRGVQVVGTTAYVVSDAVGLLAIDVSEPAAPSLVFSEYVAGYAKRLRVRDGHAFVAMSDVQVFDVQVGGTLGPTGQAPSGAAANGLAAIGDYLLVADSGAGLRIVDVSDPAAPLVAGVVNTPGLALAVDTYGDLAFVADYSAGMKVIDVAVPAAPTIVGSIATSGSARDVKLAFPLAYVADGAAGLWILDVSHPSAPAAVNVVDTPHRARSVALQGAMAYVADEQSGLQIIDVSDPGSAHVVGGVDTGYAYGVAVRGTYAFVAGATVFSIVDVSNPALPQIVGSGPMRDSGVSVFLHGPYAYVAGRLGGFQVFDISNPLSPVTVGAVNTGGLGNDVIVSGGIVFAAQDVAGISSYPLHCGAGIASDCNGNQVDDTLEIAGNSLLDANGDGILDACTASPVPERPAIVAVLHGAHPNPFNPATTIGFSLAEPGPVSLAIFDLAGRPLRTLGDGRDFAPGYHELQWDGRDREGRIVAAGVYLYRFQAAGRVETRRLALVK